MTAFNARELFEIEVSNGAPQCAPLQNGDKVIQTENDYDKDVFTGDIGIVEVENPMGACRRLRADDGQTRNYADPQVRMCLTPRQHCLSLGLTSI
jgi:hypothetical protein